MTLSIYYIRMVKQLVRRYKFEIYPSPVQARGLAQIFGCVRKVYSEFVIMNDELYRECGQKRFSRGEMQEVLTVWRDAIPWLAQTPSQALQVATHDLDSAYQNFFQGRGEKPKIKKLRSKQSFQLPQPRLQEISGQECIFLPNYKTWIPIKMHRPIPAGAKLGAATISKTSSGRHFVSIVVKFSDHGILVSKSKEMVGIDLNLKSIVLSNGNKIKTPQILQTLELRKRRLQKQMQRQRDEQKKNKVEHRSKNYLKTKEQLAKLHEKIKFQKEDFLHKLALQIYRDNQAVAMETLNVKGMMKNRRLAKSIAFQSWGRLVEIMKMYAIQYDKSLHFISTWFPSSKMCHECGMINEKLTLSDREWTCEGCHAHHDRDENAASNIASEGGSYPAYKPVERKGSVRRPTGRKTTMSSVKQESSRFEVAA